MFEEPCRSLETRTRFTAPGHEVAAAVDLNLQGVDAVTRCSVSLNDVASGKGLIHPCPEAH